MFSQASSQHENCSESTWASELADDTTIVVGSARERTGSQDRPHPSDPRNEEQATSPWGTDSASSAKPPFPQQGAHSGQGRGHWSIRKDPVRPSQELDAQGQGHDSRAGPAHSRYGAKRSQITAELQLPAVELGKGWRPGEGGLIGPKLSQLGSNIAGGPPDSEVQLPLFLSSQGLPGYQAG